MIVHTESGSCYEFDSTLSKVRRVQGAISNPLRGDEEWVPLLMTEPPCVGQSMVMVLDLRGDGVPTVRTTTPVTATC